MVKKTAKFFSYFLFFILALVVFIPKSSLYYFMEQELETFNIIVSNETLKENLLTLALKDADISIKRVESAKIETTTLTLLVFYNHISFKNIQLSTLIEAYAPSKIREIQLKYEIWNPFFITMQGTGDFGSCVAKFNLQTKTMQVKFAPSKLMLEKYKNSLHYFKKSNTGEYVYAKNF